MSTPSTDLWYELISAQSALDMEPDPIEGKPGRFLSECDGWARHSMTHLKQASKLMHERLDIKKITAIIAAAHDMDVAAQRILNLIQHGG
jgi:hypothetical protein